jgi:carbamoyl-phosphate synthase large subunit
VNLIPILVTAVCGDLGSTTVRCLAREKQYSIIGTDMAPYCPVLEDLINFFFFFPCTACEYIAAILSICKKYRTKVIIPSSEPEILFFNSARQIFEQAGIALMLNASDILEKFFDKHVTAQFIKSLGYRVPISYPLMEYTGDLSFPVIVKQRKGSGSRGVFVVNDAETMKYLCQKKNENYIIQELIGDKDQEYTIGVYSNGKHASVITFRRYLAHNSGYSREVHLVNDEGARLLGISLAEAVNLQGSINVQTRKKDGVHIPFEVNPRLSSTVMFRSLAGFADAHWWTQLLLDNPVYDYAPRHGAFVGIRHITEKVFV